jgi:hypothetical protein
MTARRLCAFVLFAALSRAETRRALLIGINLYEPPAGETAADIVPDAKARVLVPERPARTRASFRSLHGAVNDAREMRRVLIERFGFAARNIRLIEDREATRAAILAAIPRYLMPPDARQGDIGVLFFAGHGSQVLNSKTSQADHLDESLVPADSYKGVPDIRNKEIAPLLNAMIDRGLVVTFIADSCHSGSIARGIHTEGSRLLEFDPRDANDAGYTGPAPQERGALIVSSTQSSQEAKETADGGHGVFTWALARVLDSASPASPAGQIFQQTRALLQSEVSWQEPVIAGADKTSGTDRSRLTLIGLPSDTNGGSNVLVARGATGGGKILLEGGLAAMLNPGCELTTGKSGPRLRITRVLNLSQVEAEPVEGSPPDIASGTVFELSRWVVPESEALRVLIPPGTPRLAEIEQVARSLDAIRREPGVEWIEDPTAPGASPTHVLRWDTSAGWLLDESPNRPRAVSPTADAVGRLLGESPVKPVRFLLRLPPAAEVVANLHFGVNSENEAIRPVPSSAGQPHYVLDGRWHEGRVEYAWIAPDATEDVADRLALPIRTDWEPAGTAAVRLQDYAARIQKLRAWLQLASPPASGFPYTLVLKNARTGEQKADGTVVEDEEYRPALRADPAELRRLEDDGRLSSRFIYVFSIDRKGKSTLIYPPLSTGNEGNRLPRIDDGGDAPALIELGGKDDMIQVAEPFGVDTYILLATATALPDPGVLQFDGVQTAAPRRGSADPLADLLAGLGSERRRGPAAAPAKWTVTRYPFRSVPKAR